MTMPNDIIPQDPMRTATSEQNKLSDAARHIISTYGRDTPVDELALVLFEAWCKADPISGPAQHPASYIANFADMARAALSRRASAGGELHGPFGWLNGCRALSEDSWTLESDPLENNDEYFAIPLYSKTDPFKEVGSSPAPSPAPVVREGWPELAEALLAHTLKPEEIAGPERENRINELLHWFKRYNDGNANPKWLRAHASELAYYIATLHSKALPDVSEEMVEAIATLYGNYIPGHGWTGFGPTPEQIRAALNAAQGGK